MGSSRRQLLQTLGLVSLGLAWRPQPALAGAADPSLLQRLDVCSPHDDPLKALQTGNARFAAAWSRAAQEDDPQLRMTLLQALLGEHCQVDPKALAQGQHPWAAVLTCADSRIPVEWIFCAGAGELFGVRSAGNTAFNEGVASLEYAVELLQVPLILVMGHSGCGAVTAALGKDPLTPLLEELVTPIRAALEPRDDLPRGIQHNAVYAAAQLAERSAVLQQAVDEGRLKIQPSYFDIASGAVTLL